jgi:hypothetical protein
LMRTVEELYSQAEEDDIPHLERLSASWRPRPVSRRSP